MEIIEKSLFDYYLSENDVFLNHLIQTSIPNASSSKIQHSLPKESTVGRHVTWTPGDVYLLLCKGIPVRNEAEIFELHQQKRLTPAYFYIFKHKDALLQRNVHIPVYEAVYWCCESNHFVLVQKRHLRAAYAAVSQNKRDHMHDINVTTGYPYWVDRH